MTLWRLAMIPVHTCLTWRRGINSCWWVFSDNSYSRIILRLRPCQVNIINNVIIIVSHFLPSFYFVTSWIGSLFHYWWHQAKKICDGVDKHLESSFGKQQTVLHWQSVWSVQHRCTVCNVIVKCGCIHNSYVMCSISLIPVCVCVHTCE